MAGRTAGWRMRKAVIEFRKTPLFVRIGLMWWVVLLAWPPTRRYVVPALPAPGLDPAGHVMGALASLAFSLSASWIVVRLLRVPTGLSLLWELPVSTIFVAWFAVASWSFVLLSLSFGVSFDMLRRATLVVPMLVVSTLPEVTWLVLALAVATVWLVHRSEQRPGGPTAEPEERARPA
jgi:hypothetical protein